MSTPTGASPPTTDSRAASIAWAVAAIVVALVVAFIAWLAMGDRGGSDGPAADAPTTTQEAEPESTQEPEREPDQQREGDGPPPQQPAPEAGEQTPPPEIVDFMLGLQRRDADDPMAVGEVDAPVVMIEYADYRCPYCAQHHRQTRPELDPLVADGTLRIEFRDLVIFDETSMTAAVGGRAAAAQGLLQEYQHEVFALSEEGHGEYGQEELMAIAEQIGVADLEAFEAAFDDPEVRAAVEADTSEARSIGITSTPSFLINTQVVQGAYPIQHFRQVIADEAEKATQDSR